MHLIREGHSPIEEAHFSAPARIVALPHAIQVGQYAASIAAPPFTVNRIAQRQLFKNCESHCTQTGLINPLHDNGNKTHRKAVSRAIFFDW
jgi:hypothetical protein